MPSVLESVQAALTPGYLVERELGHGGMATVYLAHDRKHDRLVALKTLRPELIPALGPDRFLREIQIAARLQHPNILPLHDSGEAGGLLYYVMPYVEGESLRARLEREGQLPIEEALDIGCQVAEALAYAHSHDVVHRDIKPENILLNGGHALVADFGIARAITAAGGERLTETGLAIGTAAYMSPEQAAGEARIDGRSDIYSLGCVLYEMLVGNPPFTGASAQAVVARKLTDPVPPPRTVRETVPESVERVILKALARQPVDRFRTAEAFASALKSPGPAGSTFRAWPRAIVRATVAGVAAIALAVAVAVIALPARSPIASPPSTRQLTFVGDVLSGVPSPDGQFLAYAIPSGDFVTIKVQDLAGGAPVTLADVDMVNTLEWSPDGTRLLVGSRAVAIILPRLGGSGRNIPWSGQGWAVHAYWLPDGDHVSLHTNSSGGASILQLATGHAEWLPIAGQYTWLMDGSWSPDGGTFAVVTFSSESVGCVIRAASRDGRTEVITKDSVPLGSPHWSAGGDDLYYSRGNDAIWRVSASRRLNGRGRSQPVQQQLEMIPGLGATQFGLTPDGRRMTYVRGTRFSNFWLLKRGAAGAMPVQIELTRGTTFRRAATVSPDGRWIGFVGEANGVAELFHMPIDGGVATQVTFGANVLRPESQIAWSPDGNEMAFVSARGSQAQVSVARVDGGNIRAMEGALTSAARGHLTWAPGARIAYQTPDHRNIMLRDPSNGAESALRADTTGFLFNPRYTPRGDQLSVLWGRSSEDVGTWIFNPESRSFEKLLEGSLELLGWGTRDREIYARTGDRLYRVDLETPRKTRPLMQVPWRNADCIPAGARRPDEFICTRFDFVSDVWMIEHFASGDP